MVTRQVKFGIFDVLDQSGAPLRQLYAERLLLAEAADAAGFHCYHVAEHHGTPLSVSPSPAVFLAAMAARTSRMRLGPLCFLLPLYEPLRLIEEICMLDQLSNGRLELGVSRGVSPFELAFFGVDAADSRAIFRETLDVVLAGLAAERLTFDGAYHHYKDVPMELTPLQRPYPPLWYPTTELASMEYVAGNGFNFVGLGPAARVRAQVDAYWQIRDEHRDDPARLNAHVENPLVGINRHILVAATDEEALAVAKASHAVWNRSILKLWHDHDDHSEDGKFSWEAATEHETFIYGSPARVAERVDRLVEVSGCNYVNLGFAWGSLTHEQSMRSLQLFADEVMPRFTSQPTLVASDA